MALAIGIFKPRDCWAWIWVAVAQDLDYASWILYVNLDWPNAHRALFHNVWILGYLLGFAVYKYRGFAATADRRHALTTFVQLHAGFLLVPYYYATHLILDAFQGGFVPFWPFSKLTVYWDFSLDVDTATQRPVIQSDPGTYVGVPQVSTTYTWLTGEEFAFLVLFLLTFALGHLYQRRTRRLAGIADAKAASDPTTLL